MVTCSQCGKEIGNNEPRLIIPSDKGVKETILCEHCNEKRKKNARMHATDGFEEGCFAGFLDGIFG